MAQLSAIFAADARTNVGTLTRLDLTRVGVSGAADRRPADREPRHEDRFGRGVPGGLQHPFAGRRPIHVEHPGLDRADPLSSAARSLISGAARPEPLDRSRSTGAAPPAAVGAVLRTGRHGPWRAGTPAGPTGGRARARQGGTGGTGRPPLVGTPAGPTGGRAGAWHRWHRRHGASTARWYASRTNGRAGEGGTGGPPLVGTPAGPTGGRARVAGGRTRRSGPDWPRPPGCR